MYKIIKTFTLNGAEEMANFLIQKGFQPSGGIFRDRFSYIQVMWKPIEVESQTPTDIV